MFFFSPHWIIENVFKMKTDHCFVWGEKVYIRLQRNREKEYCHSLVKK